MKIVLATMVPWEVTNNTVDKMKFNLDNGVKSLCVTLFIFNT
jgi:hypothetical protein